MPQLFGRKNFRTWLAIVGCSTLVLGAAFAIAQQATRLGANDLPLAAAQTARHELAAGNAADDVVPSTKTELGSDSTQFLIVTNAQEKVLASSATIKGQNPLPPSGVFKEASVKGIDTVTWQPASKIRSAIVVLPYNNIQGSGYIVAGQSLSPVEDHIEVYGQLALAAWLAVVALSSLLLLTPEPWLINRLGGAKQAKKSK